MLKKADLRSDFHKRGRLCHGLAKTTLSLYSLLLGIAAKTTLSLSSGGRTLYGFCSGVRAGPFSLIRIDPYNAGRSVVIGTGRCREP